MSFIMKNPLSIPVISENPPSPPTGARGLFAKRDNWYDIDHNGKIRKISNFEQGEGENSIQARDMNSKAIGDYSIAIGKDTFAGIKGYYFSNIDFTTNSITLTEEQGITPTEPFTIGYAVGDVVSMNNGSKFPNCSTIVSINNNIVTVDTLPFTSIAVEDNPEPDDFNFYVIKKPTVGEVNLGWYSFATGENTHAIEKSSHTEGSETVAYGAYAHAEGKGTIAHYTSHAEGRDTQALGNISHAEGRNTIASGYIAHAEGYDTQAIGKYSHSEGDETIALGDYSHAEGHSTIAEGNYSHTEGNLSKATGEISHAEGDRTIAQGHYSHAEGRQSEARGSVSHAEGRNTISQGNYSHAEGDYTKAIGEISHAEGDSTEARGQISHAEGKNSIASGYASHAEGWNTIAYGEVQHVQGKFNLKDDFNIYAHIVGGGTSNIDRKNIHTIDWSGNAWYAGEVRVGSDNEKLATVNNILDIVYQKPVTKIPTTLATNKKYNFGEVSDMSLAFPTTAQDGDVVYLTFKSGAIATTLTIDTTNTTDIEIIPDANCYYEIFGSYNGSIWLVNYSEYLVSEV